MKNQVMQGWYFFQQASSDCLNFNNPVLFSFLPLQSFTSAAYTYKLQSKKKNWTKETTVEYKLLDIDFKVIAILGGRCFWSETIKNIFKVSLNWFYFKQINIICSPRNILNFCYSHSVSAVLVSGLLQQFVETVNCRKYKTEPFIHTTGIDCSLFVVYALRYFAFVNCWVITLHWTHHHHHHQLDNSSRILPTRSF